MKEGEDYLLTFRCNACDGGPCVANCSRRPDGCLQPAMMKFTPDCVAVCWRRVRNVGDDLNDLWEWKEGKENGCFRDHGAEETLYENRLYPDWFYNLTGNSSGLAWAMRDCANNAQGLNDPWERQEERQATLKRYKKEEIAEAFANYGFSAGVLYSEWRRKVAKEDDWELIDEGEDY